MCTPFNEIQFHGKRVKLLLLLFLLCFFIALMFHVFFIRPIAFYLHLLRYELDLNLF